MIPGAIGQPKVWLRYEMLISSPGPGSSSQTSGGDKSVALPQSLPSEGIAKGDSLGGAGQVSTEKLRYASSSWAAERVIVRGRAGSLRALLDRLFAEDWVPPAERGEDAPDALIRKGASNAPHVFAWFKKRRALRDVRQIVQKLVPDDEGEMKETGGETASGTKEKDGEKDVAGPNSVEPKPGDVPNEMVKETSQEGNQKESGAGEASAGGTPSDPNKDEADAFFCRAWGAAWEPWRTRPVRGFTPGDRVAKGLFQVTLRLKEQGVTELRHADGSLKPAVGSCLHQILKILKEWDSGLEDCEHHGPWRLSRTRWPIFLGATSPRPPSD